MNPKVYEFESVIWRFPDQQTSYLVFPYDIRKEFGRGIVRVSVTIEDVTYNSSIVNRGFKNRDGSVRYIIRIQKEIREKLGKMWGDRVTVSVRERE